MCLGIRFANDGLLPRMQHPQDLVTELTAGDRVTRRQLLCGLACLS